MNALTPALGNPAGCNQAGSGNLTCEAVWNALTTTGQGGQVEPSLATAWKATTPTTWTFTLRKGVKFSNGEPFDANSVVTSLRYYQSTAQKSQPSFANVATVASVKPGKGGNAVVITTIKPDPVLPAKLTSLWMLPPKYLGHAGPQGYAKAPIGTGPYRVSGQWAAQSLSLVRNPSSWVKASNAYSGIDFTVIASDAARLQAMQSGQIGIDDGLSFDQASAVKGQGDQVYVTPATSILSLQFINTSPSPLSKAGVRYALNLAIDRPSLVKNIFDNYAKAANQGAAPGTFGYDASLPPYPYDVAKAKQLLAQAGYPHGFSITATITPQLSSVTQAYEAVVQQLGQIGVKVTLKSVPFSQWIASFTGASWGSSSAFSIGYLLAPQFDASDGYTLASCLQAKVFYCDHTALPYIKTVDTSMDKATRSAAFMKLAKYYYTSPPALFIAGAVNLAGVGQKVGAFGFTPDGSVNFATLGQ